MHTHTADQRTESHPQPLFAAMPSLRHTNNSVPRVSSLLRQVLDILGTGVLLVDGQTGVLHANPTACGLCHGGAALALEEGQLRLSATHRLRLEAAVLGARRGQWSMLVLQHGSQPMAVGVVPMEADAGCPDLAAALVIGNDGRPSRLALQFFNQAHGLTSAEGAVLAALCQGMKPAQVAASGGVAVCTVRSQISAVRQKTQASSISHLMRMVSGLPPIGTQVPVGVSGRLS